MCSVTLHDVMLRKALMDAIRLYCQPGYFREEASSGIKVHRGKRCSATHKRAFGQAQTHCCSPARPEDQLWRRAGAGPCCERKLAWPSSKKGRGLFRKAIKPNSA